MSSNEQPCPDTYWLPGATLAAGPYPGFDVETIRSLLDAGIRAFIDLTQEGELGSYEAFLEEEATQRDIDVSYARFEIRDGHAPDRDLPRNRRTAQLRPPLDKTVGKHTVIATHDILVRPLGFGSFAGNRVMAGQTDVTWKSGLPLLPPGEISRLDQNAARGRVVSLTNARQSPSISAPCQSGACNRRR